jgi:transposase
MSRIKPPPRVFSRAFKLGIIRRIMAGENVSALGREVRLSRKDLYAWRDRFLTGGPEALRGRGRPSKAELVPLAARQAEAPPPCEMLPATELEVAQRRIADLERKIGQQQVELDFFRQALRQVAGPRQPNSGIGVTASTRSSKR